MRRVPHPQPTPLDPPVYGREKLRSASFTTQLRSVSLSSNDVKVKQTAEECLLEILTNAGEGMDIDRLARKVSVSVFKKFGCKSFAENVFLELINNGPFRKEGGRVFYVKEEKPATPTLPSLPSVAQIKMEKLDKPVSPSISQDRLERISRSADQSFEHETSSPSSKVRQPLASAEHILNRGEGQQISETKTNNDGSVETIPDLKKTETITTPSKLKTSQSNENGDENYPGLFTAVDVNSPGAKTITALKKLDPTRLNALLDVIIQVIARVAGNPYPIGQLLTEVTKLSDFTTVEIVLAIGNGPFTISELAQVDYVPELDTEAPRRNKYQTLNTVSPVSQLGRLTAI